MTNLIYLVSRLFIAPLVRRTRNERGDVPGWVLVTVMSAGVVAVLYGVAKEELTDMLRNALHKVQ